MKRFIKIVLPLMLMAIPAIADDTIRKGIDVWETKSDGNTYVDLNIPAGFFCATSAPFSGRIVFKGSPIATDPASALKNTDTVIERTADTTFDANNTARVNGIVRAACFAGTAPITVSGCAGSAYWDVKSTATPTQAAFPITIRRSSSTATGGSFDSDVTISPQLIFTQQGSGLQRTLDQATVHFTTAGAEWTHSPGSGGVTYPSSVRIDANCDGSPETAVPGTSNFAPGWSQFPQTGCSVPPCPVPVPHQAPEHRHWVTPPPPPRVCYCDMGFQTQCWGRGSSCSEAQANFPSACASAASQYCQSIGYGGACQVSSTITSSCWFDSGSGMYVFEGYADHGCKWCESQ